MINVLNIDGQRLTPCVLDRAWREVNRARAVWIDEQTIQLLYNPFLYREYRKAALKRDRYTCLWCGRSGTTVDHIIPSSKGGSDRPYNLLAACMECNTKRGDRPAFAYWREKVRFAPRRVRLMYRIVKANVHHQLNRLS
ncbi:HNH endonuclease [Paenibacillus xanthanilyticus]|uniref:HNH endonuclease n=1 Tax=Paenibacillus xanthanilyticus TaxID=1783531 RepID=A0ABV8JW12_9BACL